MKDRGDLLQRLISAQMKLRGRLEDILSPGLQAEFAEVGGLTLQQVEVVRRLLAQGSMTMLEVARARGIGASGATQLIDRLERRELVARVRDDSDRRVQRVVPRQRARDLARRFSTGIGEAAVSVFAVLDDTELETYVELTERIAQAWTRDAGTRARREGA